MASLTGPTNPFPRHPITEPEKTTTALTKPGPKIIEQRNTLARANFTEKITHTPRKVYDQAELKEREARERREETNKKIASQKAISIILRREATKAVIEKKKKGNSKKLLPRTVLEALHERITALRWESALKVFELLREQLWYRPDSGIYIKLIVMLGKCKQPEKAHTLFQEMIEEGCVVNIEAYTALLSAYSRSGNFDEAFYLLEQMKKTPNCQPDVFTYSILIKSCLQFYDFEKTKYLLSEMASEGIEPNTITYNILIDAYGKAKK